MTTFYVCRDATGRLAVFGEGQQTDDVISTAPDFETAMAEVIDLRQSRLAGMLDQALEETRA